MKKLIKEVGLSVLISMTTGQGGTEIIQETAKLLSSSAFDRSLEKGIREIAEINWDRASYLRTKIAKLKNYEVDPAQTIFNEFRVKSNRPFAKVEEKLMAQGIFPGVALEPFYPELKDEFLVCATETKSKEDLDRFAEALARC